MKSETRYSRLPEKGLPAIQTAGVPFRQRISIRASTGPQSHSGTHPSVQHLITKRVLNVQNDIAETFQECLLVCQRIGKADAHLR